MKILIVGSGLFGSVFARQAIDDGHEVVVIDKRNHIGGNCFTFEQNGIHIHKYGPHIFHTNDQFIWDWVNRFAKFNNFTLRPVANFKGEIFSLPFNMWTFNKLWGVITPKEAEQKINSQRYFGTINNLEEQALSLVGSDVYEKLIKYYTKKQWGMNPTQLPSFIIKRLPVRYTYDNNYFNDKYQGIPIGGYTKFIENILEGIEVKLNFDFFLHKDYRNNFDKIVYTGPIDAYYNYEFGKLDYRSLMWKTETIDTNYFQGVAMMNFTDENTKFTRIIEHKLFDESTSPINSTIISYEFPADYKDTNEPFYPINNSVNQAIFEKYKSKSKQEENIIFGGRLAEYLYYDMHQIIGSAFVKYNLFKNAI
jgi:UDP-galactopyranose mutase